MIIKLKSSIYLSRYMCVCIQQNKALCGSLAQESVKPTGQALKKPHEGQQCE